MADNYYALQVFDMDVEFGGKVLGVDTIGETIKSVGQRKSSMNLI